MCCFLTKENLTKKRFLFLHLLVFFCYQKLRLFLTNNEENLQNPNHLMKFSEIWYVDASQQQKCYKETFSGFRPFLAVFQPKNSQKKRWRKLAKSKPFDEISEIWYVDVSQQTKNATTKSFLDFGLFWPFNQKTAKIDQKWRKLAKSKPFDEIFWNFVCRSFLTK